jgi:protein O-GlcNAc transferase
MTQQEHIKRLKVAHNVFSSSLQCKDPKQAEKLQLTAAKAYHNVLDSIDVAEYLLIDNKPTIPKNIVLESFFTLGNIYKLHAEQLVQRKMLEARRNKFNRTSENATLTQVEYDTYTRAIDAYKQMLRINFEDTLAIKQIVSVLTQLALFHQDDLPRCLQYLQECLRYLPDDDTIHYNLGSVFQKLNKTDMALIHYKLSISLGEKKLKSTKKSQKTSYADLEHKQLLLNNLNGISGIYRSVKYWPEALYYLQKAEAVDPEDPDIQNQLGVVYTEMRRTDLAEKAYLKGIKNYQNAFISTDKEFLLSELHLNYGHMHSYNGDNMQAVENYNKAISICPKFTLPFQNKIMNMTYLFDVLDDKMYISKQHQLINKIYKKGNKRYVFPKTFYNSNKINIGIVSGDFVDHPVSFFIRTFLEKYNAEKFSLTCYSECLIDTKLFNDDIQFKFIKNMNTDAAADLIYQDNIHILFDLAGHTAFNRLDVFALKPAPIQISYIGYPFSTGLDEMDYRITDLVCDNPDISQKMYTETLLFAPGCFLCYDPTVIRRANTGAIIKTTLPPLNNQQFLKNNGSKKGTITIGCFNRLNKITDKVIKVFNKILVECPNTRFLFKTKALLNPNIKEMFLQKFDSTVRSRIDILDCTLTHEQHLSTYNMMDVAIDTFPYSGTTTSCEALFMGVPVFTIYDTTHFFHAQNVTASILKNTNPELEKYICKDEDDLVEKIKTLQTQDTLFWTELKPNTRGQFLNGDVCNKDAFISKIDDMLTGLFHKHKSLV